MCLSSTSLQIGEPLELVISKMQCLTFVRCAFDMLRGMLPVGSQGIYELGAR